MGEADKNLPKTVRMPIPANLVTFQPTESCDKPAQEAMRANRQLSAENTFSGSLSDPEGKQTREVVCWLEWNPETQQFELVCEGREEATEVPE